ncbi:MAG TPA: S8 family serine peptidase [Polyangiaceae bacterium]|nr:S8 family serine peptidase [Polyangiaceae bacterium]
MKHSFKLGTGVALLGLAGLGGAPADARADAGAGAPGGVTFTVVLTPEAVADAALAAVEAAGGELVNYFDELGVIEARAGQPTTFVRAVVGRPDVASVGPTLVGRLAAGELAGALPGAAAAPSPADPTDPAAYLWNVERVTRDGAAWSIHAGTHDVVVAVLDTGIDLAHPDLVANLVPGSRSMAPGASVWDDHGHGTHVAGTIAAAGRIEGVAPGVGIRAYRIYGPNGELSVTGLANAVRAAADDGADVINLSLGFMQVRGQVTFVDPVTGERTALGNDVASLVALERAVRYAVNRNAVVVGGAGNDAIDLTNPHAVAEWFGGWLEQMGLPFEVQGAAVHVPGGLPGVLTVSAAGGGWGTADRLADYASYGHGVVDLTAPGGDLGPLFPEVVEPDFHKYLVLSTAPTYLPCQPLAAPLGLCDYAFAAGTSMAIPAVSGAAALVISEAYARTGAKPSPAQVTARLQQAAEDVGAPGNDALFGRGMVDAHRALTLRLTYEAGAHGAGRPAPGPGPGARWRLAL